MARPSKDDATFEFIIMSEDGETPAFKIVQTPQLLDFEVLEYRKIVSKTTKEERMDYVSIPCYYHNLESALIWVRDRLVKKSKLSTSDVTELKKTITRCNNQIIKAVDENVRIR